MVLTTVRLKYLVAAKAQRDAPIPRFFQVNDVLRVILGLMDPCSRRMFTSTNRLMYRMRPKTHPRGTYIHGETVITVSIAALHGYLDLVKYFHSLGWNVDSDVCKFAARGGHLEIVKWYVNLFGLYFDGNYEAVLLAAEYGHIHILQYFQTLTSMNYHYVAQRAASGGQVHVLKWLETDFTCSYECMRCAIRAGKLEVVRWLRKKRNLPITEEIYGCACSAGYLHILKWMGTLGLRLVEYRKYYKSVILSGFLTAQTVEILGYLRSIQGSDSFDETTMNITIAYGSFDLLRWLRGQCPPCPWWSGTMEYLLEHHHLNMAKWAVDNGCPCRPEQLRDLCFQEENPKQVTSRYRRVGSSDWNEHGRA